MSTGEDLLAERRRRRQAGDPRLSPDGRVPFRRMTGGDLVDEFEDTRDADVDTDPVLAGDGSDE